MKKLIPLFTFTFGLHLSLFALSISSEKIDTFMHLPDWMPTSVDAEHTFGSDEHTNCTHRTTLDTLAAVESVFDAYHERVFYASEGRSNDWDVAVYGPRPTDLQRLWFTKTDSNASCFVYSTWTNAWPRATPESRRLLEFDNLFGLAEWIPSLFGRVNAPWLDKGDTWGRERNIMFGSSWGPAAADLPEIGWTENGSFRPDLAACCVPLCYCSTDTVFNTSSSSEDGFLWDVLRDLDTNFNALYRIEGGPLPTYSVATNGYLAEWHNAGSWTNSPAAKASVPSIITNRFQLAAPEFAMTNLTRRLVPDDSFHVDVKTNGYRTIEVRSQSKMASSLFDFSGRRASTRLESVPYDVVLDGLYSHDRYVSCRAVPDETFRPFDVGSISPTNNFDFGDAPSGTARVEVDITCNGLEVAFTIPPVIGYSWYSVLKNDADVNATVTYKAWYVVTNRVSTGSSILATESRALAMLDRTYEIPMCVVQTNIPETASVRDTERRFSSSLLAESSMEIQVELEYPFTPLHEEIMLEDLLSGSTPVVEYSTTNLYSSISRPTVVWRRMSGRGIDADGGFNVYPRDGGMPTALYTAGDLKEYLADYYKMLPGAWGMTWKIIRLSAIDNGFGQGVVTFFIINSGQRTDNLHIFNLRDLVPESPVTLTVAGYVRVERSASALIGGVPGPLTFDRMYPSYGPGPYGYADGLVDESRVLFAEEVLAFTSKMYDGYWSIEWDDEPISIPLVSTQYEIDTRPFTWRSWHRISVSQPSGGVGSGLSTRVYEETYNALRAKVDAEFRAEAGDYSTASSVIPVNLNMARISDVSLSGFRLGLGGSYVEKEMEFVINGPLQSDVKLRFTGGDAMPDEERLLVFSLNVGREVSGDVYAKPEFSGAPVAVDGRLSPVIVTDWNWKALKSYTNE